MPAYAEEIEEALQEGVLIESLTSPEEIVSENRTVAGVKCRHMHLGEFDRSGRRRPEADADELVIPADQVIMAVGQTMDASVFGDALVLSGRGWIEADPTSRMTSLDGVFAGGDSVTGPMSVVHAIGDGEKAAVAIDEYLSGEKHAFWRTEVVNTTDYDPDADPVPYPREKMRMMPIDKRRSNFDEVEQAWNEAEAVRQARRCLRCDYGKCICQEEEVSNA
ncbi:FAD-dependent oxidoreductase [Tichowtungia aerotolerans]|uniref:FAD-dependent oxidoreductase n=1 Tax=Tichowtungia aerotolerans TaxID=2697043 RepID=UPI0022B86ED1|nr:FAD-dependent oxidoreductase [Tichowtungia aerotolerans]